MLQDALIVVKGFRLSIVDKGTLWPVETPYGHPYKLIDRRTPIKMSRVLFTLGNSYLYSQLYPHAAINKYMKIYYFVNKY